ncbi:HAMP domain-containing histidine kinase [Aneurinibacillus sp. BA2021]|nr:HAMP domain-containing histidine kinase [Aneurinibacillus sp. BA2021]
MLLSLFLPIDLNLKAMGRNMGTLYECKKKLLSLIVDKIPVMIEAHIGDMAGKMGNFREVIGDMESYRDSLYQVYTKVASTLFKDEQEYIQALRQIEETGYEVGVYFGEVKEVKRKELLYITHSIRVHSFEYVSDIINCYVTDPKERSFFISRFIEILNVRFNSCIEGFLFTKDKVIDHLHNQKLSIMGQMAAGMAHEIRNPLCSIKGFQQLMKQLICSQAESRESLLNYIDICIDEINKVENLVSDFLILARKGESQRSNWGKVNVNETFQKVHEISAYFAREKNVMIHLSMFSAPLFIEGSTSYIEQIILNIIKNSVSALDVGGILLIMVYPSTDRKEVVLTFIDNGTGIPKSQLSKVFEPFYTTKEEGTGLGLPICKGLVEEMKGSIAIESREKIGTTVKIRLPLLAFGDTEE